MQQHLDYRHESFRKKMTQTKFLPSTRKNGKQKMCERKRKKGRKRARWICVCIDNGKQKKTTTTKILFSYSSYLMHEQRTTKVSSISCFSVCSLLLGATFENSPNDSYIQRQYLLIFARDQSINTSNEP